MDSIFNDDDLLLKLYFARIKRFSSYFKDFLVKSIIYKHNCLLFLHGIRGERNPNQGGVSFFHESQISIAQKFKLLGTLQVNPIL